MILDELTLHNFGVYAGRQTIILTPPSKKKPVILFGAFNGCGKTTILDALQLCMFGPIAKCSNRSNMAYLDYLRQCINHNAHPQEASLMLTFRHYVDGKEDTLCLNRSWRKTEKNISETFTVIRNDKLDRGLTENWFEQVDDFIPSKIAHLFLFDGEKIESFADQKTSATLIGAAIHNLLGLDIVDQLEKDLQTLERRKRAEEKNSKVREEIRNAEVELKALRKRYEQLQQELAQIRGQNDRKKINLKLVINDFRKAGGDLYERRIELESKHNEALVKKDTIKNQLVESASGSLPLLMIKPLLSALQDRDNEESETLRARAVLSVVTHRDEELLKLLKQNGVEKKTLTLCRNYLQTDQSLRNKNSQRDVFLKLDNDCKTDINTLLREELNKVREVAEQEIKDMKRIEEQVSHFKLEIASIPSIDTITSLIEERDKIHNEIKSLGSEIDSRKSGLERLKRDIDRKEALVLRILESEAHKQGEYKDIERTIKHSRKVRGTLVKLRQVVIARHVHKIENLVLKSFQHLLRKKSLLSGITIHPNTFELRLYGTDHREIPANRLSAGERQLLAVSMLWGLAKASGRPLPTAIDTPMGRLDTIHRSHLVERYFPDASHQVLLFSTDEEIVGDYLNILKPRIGRSYLLNYNEDSGSTTVQKGYFSDRNVINAS
ncbi:MAG: DNA sulfur modification protein DndD [Magnetococcales bacterium]|nr:DNA sulfur modification protein DndD [Magnetococcales bacterium]